MKKKRRSVQDRLSEMVKKAVADSGFFPDTATNILVAQSADDPEVGAHILMHGAQALVSKAREASERSKAD